MRLTFCQSVFGFFIALWFGLCCAGRSEVAAQEAAGTDATPKIAPIKRILPPEGIAIPEDVEKRLREQLEPLKKRFEPLRKHEYGADIEILLKAVQYALDHREFYTDKDFAKADPLLKEAEERITQLAAGKHPWTKATGLVVRGYRSPIDFSAQPYGVVIPKDFDFEKPAPLYVWLHGRGDKATDLHFLTDRIAKPGEITPPGAIVVHAFGRQCVGYLNAGEMDVLHATYHAESQYKTDPQRRVLIGFSMGGAGAWHVGAHHAWLYRVIAPGAGFAETARYQKLKPEDYPPWYEQTLWGHNDTPAYVRNLFNCEVIAYSGELDRQIQAARVMEEAFQAEGKTLTHLIGPKTEHKYEAATKATLLQKIDAALQVAVPDPPQQVTLQTRTLRYSRQHWLDIFRLEEHWQDTRVDATHDAGQIEITTKNVALLHLHLTKSMRDKDNKVQINIDGQKLEYKRNSEEDDPLCYIQKTAGKWSLKNVTDLLALTKQRVKRKESHGPIDDAFCNLFIVVEPTGKSKNPRFQAWQEFELAHFRSRWRTLMRGDLLVLKDTEITPDLIKLGNLILWGDADSNSVIKKIADKLPIQQHDGQWQVGAEKYDASAHVPVLIYPNPLDEQWPPKYVVLNSGLTFREGHDRTNSLQNPKLPDWAIIDISQPPDAFAPGKVVNAGFFDEEWKLKPPK